MGKSSKDVLTLSHDLIFLFSSTSRDLNCTIALSLVSIPYRKQEKFGNLLSFGPWSHGIKMQALLLTVLTEAEHYTTNFGSVSQGHSLQWSTLNYWKLYPMNQNQRTNRFVLFSSYLSLIQILNVNWESSQSKTKGVFLDQTIASFCKLSKCGLIGKSRDQL